jgi:pimeloyl-ACP methyl ester carboxylesterase
MQVLRCRVGARLTLNSSRTLTSPLSTSGSSGSSGSSTSGVMSYERYGDMTSPKTAIFIHGMLGNKKNMRTPCREFIKQNPEFSCITVDLRGHGNSHDLKGEPNIEECAHDLQRLIQNLNISSPNMLVAHSLAGKVALKYLELLCTVRAPMPANTWILDSLPGPYNLDINNKDDSQSVANVVKALDGVTMPQPTRTDVVKEVTQRGVALPIAQWLTTSLQQTPDGSVSWIFDLKVAKKLFQNFVSLDMRHFLENYNGEGVIHFVRAGRSDKWTDEVLSFFQRIIESQSLQTGGYKNLQLHTMPAAGHWLHSEDLPGLLKIMNAHNVDNSRS